MWLANWRAARFLQSEAFRNVLRIDVHADDLGHGVLQLVNGIGVGLCNDDFCAAQSTISGIVAGRAGIHVLFVKPWAVATGSGAFGVAVNSP